MSTFSVHGFTTQWILHITAHAVLIRWHQEATVRGASWLIMTLYNDLRSVLSCRQPVCTHTHTLWLKAADRNRMAVGISQPDDLENIVLRALWVCVCVHACPLHSHWYCSNPAYYQSISCSHSPHSSLNWAPESPRLASEILLVITLKSHGLAVPQNVIKQKACLLFHPYMNSHIYTHQPVY